jgi:hypothetical protein
MRNAWPISPRSLGISFPSNLVADMGGYDQRQHRRSDGRDGTALQGAPVQPAARDVDLPIQQGDPPRERAVAPSLRQGSGAARRRVHGAVPRAARLRLPREDDAPLRRERRSRTRGDAPQRGARSRSVDRVGHGAGPRQLLRRGQVARRAPPHDLHEPARSHGAERRRRADRGALQRRPGLGIDERRTAR